MSLADPDGVDGTIAVARLIATAGIAAAMGTLGAEAILFVMQLGGAPLFYAVPSVLTWLLLRRFVSNKSVRQAVIVGIASPLVGCAIGVLWHFQGLTWLVVLVRYWWITIPFGTATGLLVQLFTSDYSPAYRRWPRLAALGVLTSVVAVAATPAALHAARDPLRQPCATIRHELLAAVPLGSSPADVTRALGMTIPFDMKVSAGWGHGDVRDGPAYRRSGQYSVPVGTKSIGVLLGWYFTRNGRVNVYVQWAFDASGRLVDVLVEKLPPV